MTRSQKTNRPPICLTFYLSPLCRSPLYKAQSSKFFNFFDDVTILDRLVFRKCVVPANRSNIGFYVQKNYTSLNKNFHFMLASQVSEILAFGNLGSSRHSERCRSNFFYCGHSRVRYLQAQRIEKIKLQFNIHSGTQTVKSFVWTSGFLKELQAHFSEFLDFEIHFLEDQSFVSGLRKIFRY